MQLRQAFTLSALLQQCVSALPASLIAPNSPNNQSLPTPNNAEPITLNLTLATPTNTLPPQPYLHPIPHTTLTLKLQAFGHRLPPSNVLLCLLTAANDVNAHFSTPTAPMGTAMLRIRSATVRLNLYPKAMSWAQWGAVVGAITDFMTRFEFVDLDYYVLDAEVGGAVVGGGLVSNR